MEFETLKSDTDTDSGSSESYHPDSDSISDSSDSYYSESSDEECQEGLISFLIMHSQDLRETKLM